MQKEKKIVVLGAGYAGLTLSLRLDKRLKSSKIILIDSKEYHELIQQAHLITGGIKKVKDTRFEIKRILKDTNIQFINSIVKKVNADKKMVILDNDEIPYDLLVVALGTKTQSFGIENATRYGYTLRSIDDAIKIKNRIQNIIKTFKDSDSKNVSEEKKHHQNQNNNNDSKINKDDVNAEKEKINDRYNEKSEIIIVGGGPTGVGIGGTIAELIQSTGKKEQIEITLVTASSTILSGMNESMVKEATKILQRKGVRLITGSIVSDVTEQGIILKDGQKISSSITIWTPGVQGVELPFEPEVKKTKDGRIVVNEFCQIENRHEIFCIGDIGAIKDSSGKIIDPTLGQLAISQAIYLAHTIPDYLTGKQLEKFDFHPTITILPMGSDNYIGTINGNLIKGDIAKILKDFRHESYKKEIISNDEILDDYLYTDDPLTNILLGFSLNHAILDTKYDTSKDKDTVGLPVSAKKFLNKSKDISESLTK